MELFIFGILSYQFAAWYDDVTAQSGLESSNQAIE